MQEKSSFKLARILLTKSLMENNNREDYYISLTENLLEELFILNIWIDLEKYSKIFEIFNKDDFILLAKKRKEIKRLMAIPIKEASIFLSKKTCKVGLSFNIATGTFKRASRIAHLITASVLEIEEKEKVNEEAVLSNILILNLEGGERWFPEFVPSLSEKYLEFIREKFSNLVQLENLPQGIYSTKYGEIINTEDFRNKFHNIMKLAEEVKK